MSRPENVDRADQIGVFLEAAFDAQKPGLRLAVVRRHMAARRAHPRRVLRRHDDEMSAGPCQLVVQLSAELEPALVEDGFVQAGLGPNVLSRLLGGACRRPGHVSHLQVLDAHHRVVLADRGRGLVQEVAAGVADTGVKARFGSFAAVHVTQLGVHLFLDYCPRALERATK